MLAEVQTNGNISGAAYFQPELSHSSNKHQHTEPEQTVVYRNVFLKSHALYKDFLFLCDTSTKISHMLLYFYILYPPSLCSAFQQSSGVVKWKGNLHA